MKLETLLARHRAAGIIVDTNLLLLLLIGSHSPTLISSFKRTTRYTSSDFDILVEALALFSTLLTTPHILTEVSNLAGQLGDPGRQEVMRDLAAIIAVLSELQVPAEEAARDPAFPRFGLTDIAILQHASEGRYLVLTDDFRLSQYLASIGVEVINFNHLRMYLRS
jgi:rRNA-processing protein FCF1